MSGRELRRLSNVRTLWAGRAIPTYQLSDSHYAQTSIESSRYSLRMQLQEDSCFLSNDILLINMVLKSIAKQVYVLYSVCYACLWHCVRIVQFVLLIGNREVEST